MGAVLSVSIGGEDLAAVSAGVSVCGVTVNEVRMVTPPRIPAGIRAEAFVLAVYGLSYGLAAVFA